MPDATTTTATTVMDLAKNASIAGLLGVILFASYSGYWVWGTEYAKLEKDRDEWKAIALKASHLIDDVSVRSVGSPPPPGVDDLKRSIGDKIDEALP